MLPYIGATAIPTLVGIGGVGEGAHAFAERVADVAGLGGVAGRVENTVAKIRDFANEHVDALLNGAASAVRATEDFALETLDGARSKAESTVDCALDGAKEVVDDIRDVPNRASALLDDAKRIKGRALDRRDSLRKHKQRFNERMAKIPKVAGQHLEEIFFELDEELELEAQESEGLGGKIEEDSHQFYKKTVEDAERYGGQLIKQTEQNLRRYKQIKQDLKDGKTAARAWASDQAGKVKKFKSDRLQAARSIGSPLAAKSWATESIEGAHKLAMEIRDDVARKPGEIKTFGQKRVDDAMKLAQGIRQEVLTARDWAKTQKGNNAAWQRAMRENRSIAEHFFKSQASRRVALNISQHAAAIGGDARELAFQHLSDTAGEIGLLGKDVYEPGPGSVTDPTPPIDDALGNAIADEGPMISSDDQESDQRPEIDSSTKNRQVVGPTVKPNTSNAKMSDPPAQNGKKQPRRAMVDTDVLRITRASDQTHPNAPPAPSNMAPGEPVQRPQIKVSPPIGPQVQPPIIPQPTARKKPAVHSKTPNDTPIRPVNTKGEIASPIAKPTVESLARGRAARENSRSPEAPQSRHVPATGLTEPEAIAATKATFGTATGNAKAGDSLPGVHQQPLRAPTSIKHDQVVQTHRPVARSQQGPEGAEDPHQLQESLLDAGGPGETLDAPTRAQIAPHVGFDPAMVRLHTGPVAKSAAQRLGAAAFTIGRNVFFGAGKFDPRSPSGLGLIGHELTHVGQQMGLNGGKLRFHTKSGGDAMEQEAQQVGEHIASAQYKSPSVSVERFVTILTPEDDMPISARAQQRLTELGRRALTRASSSLTLGPGARQRLETIDVDLSVDFSSDSDEQIVNRWADAIVAAIQFEATSSPPSPLSVEKSIARFPGPKTVAKTLVAAPGAAKASPSPSVRQAVEARAMQAGLGKFQVSTQDKALIRRMEVFSAIKKELKRGNPTLEQYFADLPRALASGEFYYRPADIDAVLKEHGFTKMEQTEFAKEDFLKMFIRKGIELIHFILDQNKAIADGEVLRYYEGKTSHANVWKLQSAARELSDKAFWAVKRYNELVVIHNQSAAQLKKPKLPSLTSPQMKHMKGLIRRGRMHDWHTEELMPLWNAWDDQRRSVGREFPIILSDIDLGPIVTGKFQKDIGAHIGAYAAKVSADISETKEKLSEKRFLELPEMIQKTKDVLGLQYSPASLEIVNEYIKDKREDKALWDLIKSAAGIVLGIVAIVGTGGLALVAAAGSVAIGATQVVEAVEDYEFQKVAINTAIDQAERLSKKEPSLFGVAFEVACLGLDFLDAVKAFDALSSAAKAFNAANADTVVDMERAAELAYDLSRGGARSLGISRGDWVLRVLNIVTDTGETVRAAKRLKHLAELAHGTSQRMRFLLKGDPGATKELIDDFGDVGLLAAKLGEMGEDGWIILEHIRKNHPNHAHSVDNALGTLHWSGKADDIGKSVNDKFDVSDVQPTSLKSADDKTWTGPDRSAKPQTTSQGTQSTSKPRVAQPTDATATSLIDASTKSDYWSIGKVRDLAFESREGRDALNIIAKHRIDVKVSADSRSYFEFNPNGRSTIYISAFKNSQDALIAVVHEANHANWAYTFGNAFDKAGVLRYTDKNVWLSRVMAEEAEGEIRAMRVVLNLLDDANFIARTPTEGLYVAHFQARRAALVTQNNGVVTDQILRRAQGEAEGLLKLDFMEGRVVTNGGNYRDLYGRWYDEVHNEAHMNRLLGASPVPSAPPTLRTAAPKVSAPTNVPTWQLTGASSPAAKHLDEGKKAFTAQTRVPPRSIDESKRLESAGSQGSGLGVFPFKDPSVSEDVVVKLFDKRREAVLAESEYSALLAAERVGGPKPYRMIRYQMKDGTDAIGIVMSKVKGGFADEAASVDDAALHAMNEAEILANAANLNAKSISDLHAFRDGLWHQGYYYDAGADLQMFVDGKGNLRAIDVQGAAPIDAVEPRHPVLPTSQPHLGSLQEIWNGHKRTFDDYEALLRANYRKATGKDLP